MQTNDKILFGFFGVLALALLTALVIVLDPHDWHAFLSVLGVAFHAVGIGLEMIFFSFLVIGLAYAAIKLNHMRKLHEVRPGKHGAVQAIVHQGAVIHLANPTVLHDPGAQLAQLEAVMKLAGQTATMTRKMGNFVTEVPDHKQIAGPVEPAALLGSAAPQLPNYVEYEAIREQIPQDHALVGIGERGLVTRQRIIKALLWIVGGSGTGKTNTVCLRVEEDYNWGHWFLVIDPHWFKEDSLTNAIKSYADRFLMPVAYETEDIIAVLDAYLVEFKRRKAGGSWDFPITIILDEVGSLVSDKPESKQEEEMIAKIKQVARICGQESRGFEMTGMYISQDAAGLAWLRKRAIMVLAHQLLMMSERELACNGNKEIARAMDEWPIGRTLVYGIGFKEGQRVVQQPAFQPRIVESLPTSQTQQFTTSNNRPALRLLEVDTEGANEGESKGPITEKDLVALSELEKRIGEMFFTEGKNPNAIAKELWPDVKGGDAYQRNALYVADAIRKVVLRQRGA